MYYDMLRNTEDRVWSVLFLGVLLLNILFFSTVDMRHDGMMYNEDGEEYHHASYRVDSSSNHSMSNKRRIRQEQQPVHVANVPSQEAPIPAMTSLPTPLDPSAHIIAPIGYDPIRNLPRWHMIEQEMRHDGKKKFSVVDYGSNFGWFSMMAASTWPESVVLSIEGRTMSDGKESYLSHQNQLEFYGLRNNVMCNTIFTDKTFKELNNAKGGAIVFDYQFTLSVFHWLNMPNRASFDLAMKNHLMNAKTTFLELPQANFPQHHWQLKDKWYDGRVDEEQIISEAALKHGLNVQIKELGKMEKQQGHLKEIRRVFRIDNPSVSPNILPKECSEPLIEVFRCKSPKINFEICN